MISPTEPVTVTISHRLGRAEAKRRIDNGLASIGAELRQFVRALDYSWQGYRLDFRAALLMQTIAGRIDVFDEFVRVELTLSRLLHLIAKTIAGHIEQRGAALLEGPKGKG
jgi:hypothetical protein